MPRAAQSRGDILEPLMMQAIYVEQGFPKNPGGARGSVHADPVDELTTQVPRVIVVKRVGKLGWKMSIERTAEGNIHELDAAADAEQGLAMLHSPAHQRQLSKVTLQIHAVYTGMRLPLKVL